MSNYQRAMAESELGRAAQVYAQKFQWPVFPCRARDKRPLSEHGLRDATTDPRIIELWWKNWPDANIGIPTGRASGFDVLDVDPRHGGDESLDELVHAGGALPDTIEALTGGGGRHILFKHRDGTRNSAGRHPGLDVRGEGGYVVVAPSVHESGCTYEWELSSRPGEVEIGQWPEWLLAELVRPDGHDKGPAPPVESTIPEGQRNQTLTSLAGTMRRRGMSEGAMLAALLEENKTKCNPPLSETEVRRISASIGKKAPAAAIVSNVSGQGGGSGEYHRAEPQPLPDVQSPEPFDMGLLPTAFRPWIEDIAHRMQCPPDYPGVGAMLALAAVVGRQLAMRPKHVDDWQVTPNLWGGIVGRPGLLKSPALQEALRPLAPLEAQAKEAYEIAQDDYEAQRLVAEARQKNAKDEVRKAVKAGHDAYEVALTAQAGTVVEAPARRRYRTNDTSVEKLGELLNENPRGLLVFRDELSGFLSTLDKDGHETDRAFYLEAWNGTGRFVFDRIGRGTIDVDAACISILGGIQPGPLSAYMSRAARGGSDDDGLVQRFQMVVWPDPPGDWRNVDTMPDTEARERVFAVFERLDRIDPVARGAEVPRAAGELPFLRFTPEAQEIFTEWRTELEHRLRGDDLPPMLEAHLAKYRSLIPSLALLIHLVDEDKGPVGVEALSRACDWGDYLESHARRVYAPALMPAEAGARVLAGHIERGDLGNRFTARQVYRKGWAELADSEAVKMALDLLEELGWVQTLRVETSGRTRVDYLVNPQIQWDGRG